MSTGWFLFSVGVWNDTTLWRLACCTTGAAPTSWAATETIATWTVTDTLITIQEVDVVVVLLVVVVVCHVCLHAVVGIGLNGTMRLAGKTATIKGKCWL